MWGGDNLKAAFRSIIMMKRNDFVACTCTPFLCTFKFIWTFRADTHQIRGSNNDVDYNNCENCAWSTVVHSFWQNFGIETFIVHLMVSDSFAVPLKRIDFIIELHSTFRSAEHIYNFSIKFVFSLKQKIKMCWIQIWQISNAVNVDSHWIHITIWIM